MCRRTRVRQQWFDALALHGDRAVGGQPVTPVDVLDAESLAHQLRGLDGCRVTAHLLVPGFTYTGMIARFIPEKPPGAWTSEQVVEFLMEALERGDFYVLCPDNDTPRKLDEKRIQWNTDDLLKNRSALSRWDPEHEAAYEAFVAED